MSGTLLWDRLRVTFSSSSRSQRGGGKLSGSWSTESDLCDLRSLFMLGARAASPVSWPRSVTEQV